MNDFDELPILKDDHYEFNFPLEIFNDHNIKVDDFEKINNILNGRNVYFSFLDNHNKKVIFINRLRSLILMRDFILNCAKKEMPNLDIVSLYVYGSYLYGDGDYYPDDIDIGVVVGGNAFKYVIDKIEIPVLVKNSASVYTNKLSLFFYGRDNMELGAPNNDTVVAGLVHKETTKRELSIAYWRNVVIWGKDFKYIPNNEKNALITLARMINGCRERLLKLSGDLKLKEDKETIMKKVINRLVEVNLFFNFFNPEIYINKKQLLSLPVRAAHNNLSFKEIKKLYKSTVDLYSKTYQKMIND